MPTLQEIQDYIANLAQGGLSAAELQQIGNAAIQYDVTLEQLAQAANNIYGTNYSADDIAPAFQAANASADPNAIIAPAPSGTTTGGTTGGSVQTPWGTSGPPQPRLTAEQAEFYRWENGSLVQIDPERGPGREAGSELPDFDVTATVGGRDVYRIGDPQTFYDFMSGRGGTNANGRVGQNALAEIGIPNADAIRYDPEVGYYIPRTDFERLPASSPNSDRRLVGMLALMATAGVGSSLYSAAMAEASLAADGVLGVTPTGVTGGVAGDVTANIGFTEWARSPVGQEIMRQAGFSAAEIAAAATATGTAATSILSQVANALGVMPDAVLRGAATLGAGVLGAYGSTQQANAQEALGNRFLDLETARYNDTVARERARYLEEVAREQGRYTANQTAEQARFNTLAQREDANIARQNYQGALENTRFQDAVAREQGRFDTLLGREDTALQRQQDSIQFGRDVVRPFYDELRTLQQDPTSFLESERVQAPIRQGTNALARSLSAKVGNPIDNPSALQEIQSYASNQFYNKLGERERDLASWSNLPAYGGAGATVPTLATNLTMSPTGYASPPIPSLSSSLPGSVPTGGTSTMAYPTSTGASQFGGGALNMLNNSFASQGQAYAQLGAGVSNIFNPQQQQQMTLSQLATLLGTRV